MAEHTVQFPFVRDTFSKFDVDGISEESTWRPGVRFEIVGPYGDSSEAIADGIGQMILTEVSRHKPGRFPERVFYTRKFIDPDGKEFGKGKLHIASVQKFNRLCRGYGHEYEFETTTPPIEQERKG